MNKFISIFLLFFAVSCSNSNEPEHPVPQKISFDSPKVGQISYYQKGSGENYLNKTTNEYFLEDKFLSVKIEQIFGDTLFIKEEVKDSTTFTYALVIKNDSLLVFKPNSMFLDSYIFGSHFMSYKIPLNTNNSNEIDFLGWKTSSTYCECFLTGITKNYSFKDSFYDSLNIIVDETAMAVDRFGYNFLFSRKDGIVVSTRLIPQFNKGDIWFLVENK